MARSNVVSGEREQLLRDTLTAFFLIVLLAGEQIIAGILFADEFGKFFAWWFTLIALGIVFLPLAGGIFKDFSDKGWLFSQTIGLAVSGWLMWFLSSIRLLRFTYAGCIISVVICAILNIVLLYFIRRLRADKSTAHANLRRIFVFGLDRGNINHILLIESVFTGFFIFWLYIKGFQPQAYGTTEKLMDFGFMQAIWKSEYMPPEDLWLAGKSLNYYYVGQFMATYLSKLSGVGIDYGYNLMLMMTAAFSCALPAAIVFNMCRDHVRSEKLKDNAATRIFPYFSAFVSGIAVSMTSNLHYLIFAKIVPFLKETFPGFTEWADARGIDTGAFWFPDSTRYIGYNPDTADKTIHEFPSYSFILGDLHAHVINIIFVLTVVGILYAYVQYRRSQTYAAMHSYRYDLRSVKGSDRKTIPYFFSEVFHPAVILIGFFIGLFHTTNYWDYPIYFVVSGAILLFTNAVVYNFSRLTIRITVFHAAVVLLVSGIVCLPFTISFEQISTGVCLCENHTPLYQFLILWGLPILCVIAIVNRCILDQKNKGVYSGDAHFDLPGRRCALFRFIGNLEPSDMVAVTLGLCALGLVLIPEVIYVRDIYSGDYKRANTMFKLTYQSYIMFGTVMGYVVGRFIFVTRSWLSKTFATLTLIVIFLLTGYFNTSVKVWFGKTPVNADGSYTQSERLFDWLDASNYKGINAGDYLDDVNEDDYQATNWINANIEGRPVMLEVNGDSYSDYCRVSVRTGLPTLLGWTTHEWLWQSNAMGDYPPILSERSEDIRTIYTTSDAALIRTLIEKYDISYIYVGDLEKNKYEVPLDHDLLCSLGTVVYPADFVQEQAAYTTYIVRVNRAD